MTSRTEVRTKRGGFLTAILLGLAGVVDLLKAFTKPPPPGPMLLGLTMPATGVAVLGARHTGLDATALGMIVAAVLFLYAMGIWHMRRYAMTVAWAYAGST